MSIKISQSTLNVEGISLLENIVIRASYNDATAFGNLLDTLMLPAPKAEEYYYGNESDLLFLDNYGIAIRVGYQESHDGFEIDMPSDHDLILKPFKQLKLEKSYIELLPIVDLGSDRSCIETDIKFLDDQLSFSGLDFWDLHKPDNIAYIPAHKDRFGQNGLPIVVDRGAVKAMDGLSDRYNKYSQNSFYENAQDILYKPFTLSLKRAWPDDASLNEIEHKKFCQFLKVCSENRELPDNHPDKALFGLKRISNYFSERNRSQEALRAGLNYNQNLDGIDEPTILSP